jgi:hypothetical protein
MFGFFPINIRLFFAKKISLDDIVFASFPSLLHKCTLMSYSIYYVLKLLSSLIFTICLIKKLNLSYILLQIILSLKKIEI